MKANTPIAKVTKEHAVSVCLIGQGAACCRFLVIGGNGFECEKLGDFSKLLNERAEAGMMTTRGDNCDGITPGFSP